MRVIDVHLHHPGDKDPTMDAYLAHMDAHEVEAGLVHALPDRDWVPLGGNEHVLKAVQAHPDRFHGSIYIDLNDPIETSVDTIQRYADHGFRCVKLFPNLGYDPNDLCHEPVWQRVEELRLICLSHCGWLASVPRPVNITLTATPAHFEGPARRHPRINFIFAHFGGGATYLETVVMLSRLGNAYADTCPGWGRWVFENRMPGLQGVPFTQVLYGTDGAGARYGEDIAWWRNTLSDTGRSAAEIEAFFHGNAAKLLAGAERS